jgi:hypothetical protein
MAQIQAITQQAGQAPDTTCCGLGGVRPEFPCIGRGYFFIGPLPDCGVTAQSDGETSGLLPGTRQKTVLTVIWSERSSGTLSRTGSEDTVSHGAWPCSPAGV